MASKVKIPAGLSPRRDRTVREYQHDTYKLRGKLKEPTACPGCGAIFHKGHWIWGPTPKGAKQATCPACHRVRNKYPKGLVTIKGTFKDEQHEQVIGVIKNMEEKEMKEHLLSRIMAMEQRREGLVISTTDTHLPRRIGEAFRHAYHGNLHLHYNQGEDFVRVTWIQ